MATNDEIIAQLPAVLTKLQETNKRAARDAALAENRKLADLKKQQTIANKKGNAKTRADLDAIQELKDLRKDIRDREAQQAEIAKTSAGQAIALKAELESQGKVAEDNKGFQKLSFKARKEDRKQRLDSATSPAAKKEIREEARADAKKNGSKLEKIAAGIGGLFEMGKKGLKKAALGGMALLSTLAIGGLMIALGNFMQSPEFKDMTKFIDEVIMPALKSFWEFLKDNWGKIAIAFGIVKAAVLVGKFIATAKKIATAFKAVQTFMLKTMLPAVTGMVGGVVGKFVSIAKKVRLAFLTVQTFMLKTMLPAVTGMVGGVVGKFVSIAKKVRLAFLAVQAFMLTSMLPAIIAMMSTAAAFMVPLLPFIAIGVAIAAAIALVIGGLMAAFDDFQKTLEETGSITEALKVGVAKFMGFILGFIPGLVLDLVSWVAGLFGFDDFAKQVDSIDPIQFIADAFKGLFDTIEAWVMKLFKDPLGAIIDLFLAPLNMFINFGKFIYDKAVKPLIDWVGELFGVEDASGQMESYIGDKLDNIINFAGAIYDKYIKPIVDWFSNLFSTVVKNAKESPAGKAIGKAVDTAKNFTKTALRSALPKPGGSKLSFGYWTSKVIPDKLYEYAGMDPKTGEVVKQSAEAIKEQNKPVGDTNEDGGGLIKTKFGAVKIGKAPKVSLAKYKASGDDMISDTDKIGSDAVVQGMNNAAEASVKRDAASAGAGGGSGGTLVNAPTSHSTINQNAAVGQNPLRNGKFSGLNSLAG